MSERIIDLDAIMASIASLPVVGGDRFGHRHLGGNTHLARDEGGRISLVLSEADPPRFALELANAVIEHDVDFTTADGDRLLGCVMVTFATDIDDAAIGKVAERLLEMCPRHAHGDDLLSTIDQFRRLIEPLARHWSATDVIGLWGELRLLHRMIGMARNPHEQKVCLEAYQSASVHCRDFMFQQTRRGIDAKATTQTERRHMINSTDQVTNPVGGSTFLCSIMIRPVGPSEGFTVLDLIDMISADLSNENVHAFQALVASLDLDRTQCGEQAYLERQDRPTRLVPDHLVPGVEVYIPRPLGVDPHPWPIRLDEVGLEGLELNEALCRWIQEEALAAETQGGPSSAE